MSPTKLIAQHSDVDLPHGWAEAKVGDIYELEYGRGLIKAARNTDGKYPVYGSNGVVDNHDSFLVEGPLVVVGRKGAAGAVSFSKTPCWPIDTTYYVRGSDHVDIRFSFYLFTSFRLDQFDRSTAIPGLNRDDAYALVVRLPPLGEQRRIVAKIEELFSELDKGIESLQTARRQLEVYRQSVLKHAFEGKLTAQWREENKDKLEKPEQLLARVKSERVAHYERQLQKWRTAIEEWEDSAEQASKPRKPPSPKSLTKLDESFYPRLPQLPESRKWEKLGWMTCGVEYGTAAKSSKSGTVSVLRMGNIQNARFDWSDLVYTSDDDEIAKYLLHDGDVLFNRTNSPELVGKTAIYRSEHPAIFAGYLIRVNQISAVVESQYLNLFLNSDVARQYGDSVKTDGVNQSNINGAKLVNYPFPYCSVQEQREIVRILDKTMSIVDDAEAKIDAERERTVALRQAILKKAFAGHLVAQDPGDEPASVLLEKIRTERAKAGQTARRNRKAKTAA